MENDFQLGKQERKKNHAEDEEFYEPPAQMLARYSHRNIVDINKSGHWTEKENAKYYAFLLRFQDKFSVKESRRQWKVFKALSKFIKTRNPNQCRSHHHKMTKNFEDIEGALNFLRTKHHSLETRAQRYCKQLQSIDFSAIQQGTFPETLKNPAPQIEQKNLRPEDLEDHKQYDPQEKGSEIKPMDIAHMKTGADYGLAEDVQIEAPCYSISPPSFQTFPTTGLLNNLNYYPYYEPQNSMAMNYRQYRDQLWIECHQLFRQWAMKINTLMQM